MFGAKRPPAAEPPPANYLGLGPAPGTHVTPLDSFYALKTTCAPISQDTHGLIYQGCFDPNTHTEYLPSAKVFPDPDIRQQIADHENAHSWGLIHKDGLHDWAMGPHMVPGAPPLLTQAQRDYLAQQSAANALSAVPAQASPVLPLQPTAPPSTIPSPPPSGPPGWMVAK